MTGGAEPNPFPMPLGQSSLGGDDDGGGQLAAIEAPSDRILFVQQHRVIDPTLWAYLIPAK